MIVLYIFLGIIAFFVILLSLPMGICIHYSPEDEFQFKLKFAGFTLVDSSKEQPDKPPKEPKEKKKDPSKEDKKKEEKKKKNGGGAASLLKFLGMEDIAGIANAKRALDEKGLVQMLSDLAAAVGAIFARIGQLLGKGVFKHFTLRVVVGDADAADAAITYGRICGIIYPTITMLDSAMTFRRRTVDLRCDFEEEKNIIRFDGELIYRPRNFVAFLWGLFVNYLKRSIK